MNFLARFDEFHELAAKATDLNDFGPDDYHAQLKILLSDYDQHAHMTEAGATAMTNELVGKLVGRLMAQQGFKTYPQFANAKIEKPIFILGMPRTGTTVLLRLLSQDPGTQALEVWIGSLPMPRPPRDTWESNPLYQQVAAQMKVWHAAYPEFQRVHPIFADQPDECRSAQDQSFWIPSQTAVTSAPQYAQWVATADARYSYRRYRKILGLIAGGDNRRWVLKNPDHIFALDALLDVFPDACIVQTHRDPDISMASLCSLSYALRSNRESGISKRQHGQEMRSWIQSLEKAEAVRRKLDPARFFDLHIDEIQADQVGSVERIYDYFNLPVTNAARDAWRARASSDPNAGHGAHDYHLNEWGYSADDIRAEAPGYCARYEKLRERV
jgi:Sulfotransferase family